MAIGKLTYGQLPNPRIRASYDDIIRKSKCIAYKLDSIEDLNRKLTENITNIPEDDAIMFVGEVADCLEKIYSCMEYVSFVLKEVLKEKGALPSTFHKLMKKVFNNNDPASIYANRILVKFIEGTMKWYAIVHDIRSEETHYSMGEIEINDNKVFYKIQKQNGRETVYDLVREHYPTDEDPIAEYRLEYKDVVNIFLGFINSIKEFEGILLMAEPSGI